MDMFLKGDLGGCDTSFFNISLIGTNLLLSATQTYQSQLCPNYFTIFYRPHIAMLETHSVQNFYLLFKNLRFVSNHAFSIYTI